MIVNDGLNTTGLYKNYYTLLNNEKYNFKNPAVVKEILEDDAKYNWFKATLCEGMSEDQINVANIVCDTEREFLLQEMENIAISDVALGYAITYFPILCDTYCSDILTNAILYKSCKVPIFTIPRMKILAEVRNSDGSTDSWTFPRALFLIRTKSEKFELTPRKTHDLFALSASYPNEVNSTLAAVNKRYFVLEELKIRVTNTKNNYSKEIPYVLSLRADARNQLSQEFEVYLEDDDITAKCNLIGHVDFDKGLVTFNMTSQSSNSDYIFEVVSGKFSCVFRPRTGDIGRVKISVKMSGNDINVDVNEDFEYDLDVETIQEYTDIYNIDLVKTISTAIKGQILLNRDHDIAHLLDTALPEMKLNHTYEELKFQPIYDTNGYLSPGYYQSIYQNIIPKFCLIQRYIYYNTNLIPSILLCGIKTSAVLESLQEFSVTFPQMRSGDSGFNNAYGHHTISKYAFRHYDILMSHAIPDNRIYMIYKPQSKEEEHYANLVNFVYKPLYLIEEITNSEKRVFIKTRNTIDLLNTNTIGCLVLPDINETMFTYEYNPRPLVWR